MMRYSILAVGLLILTFGACTSKTNTPDHPEVPPMPTPTPEQEWNKDRTFEVMVLSNTSSKALGSKEEEYEQLAKHILALPQNSYSMIIAEQTDMVRVGESIKNPSLVLAPKLKQFAYYNLHDYSEDIAKTSLLVSKSWLSKTNQIGLGGTSYLMNVESELIGTSPKSLVFPLHIGIFRISSEEQLDAMSAMMPDLTNIRHPHLFFGTVADELVAAFEKTAERISTYALTKVDELRVDGYTYIVFIPRSCRLREVRERFAEGTSKAFNLAIETGVN